MPSCLLEPIWVELCALTGGERPPFDPGHPLGCHRRRISDRVVFEHVVAALVHGSGYERIATAGCSDRTIRRRLKDWAERGIGQQVHALARLDDRDALCEILFVLYTGIPWEFLPQELGYGSGMTCWRRLRDWHQAGVWQRLREVLLARLNAAGVIDWSRAAADGSHVRALKGGPRPRPARSTRPGPGPSTT